MPPDRPHRSVYLREGLLLLGFLLLLAAAVLSVLIPELAKDPEAGDTAAASEGAAGATER